VYKERAFVKSKIRNATSKNTHHDKDTDSGYDKKREKNLVRRSLRARRVASMLDFGGATASLLKKKKNKKKREKEEHRDRNRQKRGKRTSLFPVSFRSVVEAGCTIYRGECGFRAFRDISRYLHV